MILQQSTLRLTLWLLIGTLEQHLFMLDDAVKIRWRNRNCVRLKCITLSYTLLLVIEYMKQVESPQVFHHRFYISNKCLAQSF